MAVVDTPNVNLRSGVSQLVSSAQNAKVCLFTEKITHSSAQKKNVGLVKKTSLRIKKSKNAHNSRRHFQNQKKRHTL
jgi:hypothetical protein